MEFEIKAELHTGTQRTARSCAVNREGAVVVEYVLILAIITVGIFAIFAPTGNAKGFYGALRDGYRRVVVYVGVPLL